MNLKEQSKKNITSLEHIIKELKLLKEANNHNNPEINTALYNLENTLDAEVVKAYKLGLFTLKEGDE